MDSEKRKNNPALDPFRKLLKRAEPETVNATKDQITEFGHQSLTDKFADFAKKQPALAYQVLTEAEQQPNGEKLIEIALMVYYAIEGQMQTDKTRKKFPDVETEKQP